MNITDDGFEYYIECDGCGLTSFGSYTVSGAINEALREGFQELGDSNLCASCVHEEVIPA